MRTVSDNVSEVLEPVVQTMGYDYVGAQLGQAENGLTLRVFIDGEKGVLIEDCVAVSKQLSAVLDVEDVIKSAYALEVSSPGIERPLFTPAQFEQQVGEVVRVRMNIMQAGRRNFKGKLITVEGNRVIVEVDGEHYELDVSEMENASVVKFSK